MIKMVNYILCIFYLNLKMFFFKDSVFFKKWQCHESPRKTQEQFQIEGAEGDVTMSARRKRTLLGQFTKCQ